MDNFVKEKLTQWDLSDLIDRFKDEGIDKNSLYCLEDQEIRDLIPKIGPRSRFKAQLKLLKGHGDAVYLEGQQMSQDLPSRNTNNKGSREPQQGWPNITKDGAAQQPVHVSDIPSWFPVTQIQQKPTTSSQSAPVLQKKCSKPMVCQGTRSRLPSTGTVGSAEPQQGQPIPKEHAAQQPVHVSDEANPYSSQVTKFKLHSATSSYSASGLQKKSSEPMADQGTQSSLPLTLTGGKRKIDLSLGLGPSEFQQLSKQHCTGLGTYSEDEVMMNAKNIMRYVSFKLETQQTKLTSFVTTKIKDLQTDKRELVGVFGRTGAGKSSLINAMIKEKDLLPSGDIHACTSVMIKVEANMQTKYEAYIEFITEEDWQEELSSFYNFRQETTLSMECAEIYRDIEEKVLAIYGEEGKNKKPEELINKKYFTEIPEFLQSTTKILTGDTALQLKSKILKYTRSGTVKGVNRLYWPLVKCVTIKVPKTSTSHLLQHVTLVDLPGSGDRNKSRDQMWKELVQSCSLVWIVAEVNRAASEREPWEILENTCRLMGNGGKCQQIHFICTKTDIIEDSDEHSAVPLPTRIHERNKIAKTTVEQEFSKQKKTKRHFSENCFKVFTVSSKEFFKERHLRPEETEIPRLQQVLQDLNDHHSVTLNYVCGAFGIVSLLKGAGLKDGENKKSALYAELEENMKREFSQISKTMNEAYNTFERCLSKGVIKSTSSCATDLRRFFIRKTFPTLQCMMRNKGTHKPKNSKRGKEWDLNLKLSKYLIESIDGEFRKTFPNEVEHGAFGGVINNFSLDTHTLIQKYKEMELQLLFLQTEEAKMKLKLSKKTQECKRHSYNSLTDTITQQMEECYKSAAWIRGEGALNKVKEMIEIQVCKKKTIMFEQAKRVMLDKMRNLKETELKMVKLQMQESIVMALKGDQDKIPDVSDEFKQMKRFYTYMNEKAAHETDLSFN